MTKTKTVFAFTVFFAAFCRNGSLAIAASTNDSFGVAMIYPTAVSGREWFLPVNADQRDLEWRPEGKKTIVTRVGPGVFRTAGNNGQIRLSVVSPKGKAWWRNVEMTAYFRYVSPLDSHGQSPHWELMTRGERHSHQPVTASAINDGILAPAGTVTWPGYPFAAGGVNVHCLGTGYHGNAYPSGRMVFEKEISHRSGYGDHQRGETVAADFAPLGNWFGIKFILRNKSANKRVHMEIWLDKNATGAFTLATQMDDETGAWKARTSDLDGCVKPPFRYGISQLITWAGPSAIFRADGMLLDFKWLSVREIAPLP